MTIDFQSWQRLRDTNEGFSQRLELISFLDEDWQSLGCSQKDYSSQRIYRRALINQLAARQLSQWLIEEYGIEGEPKLAATPDARMTLELVNGICIEVGEVRIVLIPQEGIPEAGSAYQMNVPAEWVKIPAWSAHFYLGLSVNFEQKLICVEGYTTQKTLVERAIYSHLSAEYALDEGDLETDLDCLCLEIELQGADVVTVQPILKLSPQRANTLINALSNPQEVADRVSEKKGGERG